MATMKYQIDDYKQTFRLNDLPSGSFYKSFYNNEDDQLLKDL